MWCLSAHKLQIWLNDILCKRFTWNIQWDWLKSVWRGISLADQASAKIVRGFESIQSWVLIFKKTLFLISHKASTSRTQVNQVNKPLRGGLLQSFPPPCVQFVVPHTHRKMPAHIWMGVTPHSLHLFYINSVYVQPWNIHYRKSASKNQTVKYTQCTSTPTAPIITN